MDGLQIAELPPLIPEELRRVDAGRATDAEQGEASPELRWRWALFEIVVDALRVIHHPAERSGPSVWKDEARLRASSFLELALADSFGARMPHLRSGSFQPDVLSISRLAQCYLSLQQNRVRGPIECEDTLQDICLGLAAAYQPAVRTLDLQLSSSPIRLRSDSHRAFILFMNCMVQGMLGRASRLGSDGRASLKLSTIEPSTVHLRVETCDSVAEIFGSPEYDMATKIAAVLEAEFVCREGPANRSILEMQFSTEPRETSLGQTSRR